MTTADICDVCQAVIRDQPVTYLIEPREGLSDHVYPVLHACSPTCLRALADQHELDIAHRVEEAGYARMADEQAPRRRPRRWLRRTT